MDFGISVIGLVSYDYSYLYKSIPSYIDFVDEVLLGFDEQRLTWAGEKIEIPGEFFERIKQIDKSGKIRLIEGSFYEEGIPASALEIKERNLISTHAKKGNWIVSLDCDEVLINAAEFFSSLRSLDDRNVCVTGSWINIYKRVGNSLLAVTRLEPFPIATRQPQGYITGRWTAEPRVASSAIAIHFSWARTPDEMEIKLRNWGHRLDFNIESFLNLWKSVDQHNFQVLRNFNPINSVDWPGLCMISEPELANGDLSKISNKTETSSPVGLLQQLTSRRLLDFRNKLWNGAL